MEKQLADFTNILCDDDEIANSQPLSLPSSHESVTEEQGFPLTVRSRVENTIIRRPPKHTGQHGDFRSVEEIDPKYRHIFTYPYFNLVQSRVIEDALYSAKSMVVCAPTGSGKTVVFEMAIVQLLMDLEDKNYTGDFKIIYMAPVKALCAERLSEWYPKFTKLGLMCIEVTGDTDVDFSQIKPYRIIVTTPEKWDMLTRRWRDHRGMADVIKLFLIDEVHILNDAMRGPVLEAVVSRMKTVEVSQKAAHRIEQLQKQYNDSSASTSTAAPASIVGSQPCPPRIRFVAVSATVSNPEDVAAWLGTSDMPAVYYKFGDECRPVKLKRVVEGYPCPEGMSIFKFDIILNYKLWPVIQKYHDGKPTLIFCNTRKSVALTAETLSRELTVNFNPDQKAKLTALASTIKNKKLQALVLNGVGCHHAGLLYEERLHIEEAFRNRDLPILITTTTLAMGVNLPAHLVIIKNTQQYVNGQYQEYSISTVLQMVGRAGRPQFDTEATAVIMTRFADKSRYQSLVGGDEPLQSYLHKRLPENLNSEAALGTVCDVAQCVQWLRSTFLSVRAVKDPRRYLGLAPNAPPALISKKVEELCVKAMNGLASAGLITMDEASCIESTEAGRLMSVFYLDLETMKQIMKIEGNESIDKLLSIVCESHELSDMHLRMDERRTLNALNRNNAAATIRFPMKGKINTRQMKLNCIIQAVLGCLPIPDPSLNQEAMKIMRIADRICKCLVAYVTRPDLISSQPQYFSAVLNSILLAKCVAASLWENSPYVSKQLRGIGPTFSTLLASAGKVNFTLLEESHPRDLERIMNKGAPAGNILRKQVGFLPKYQLTASPLDESRVSMQLLLINQNYLAENRENLTAGDAHKCYIIAGDSENYLLFFSSFKDKDLIGVYDGIITMEITRKHRFEHKVFVHCISSNWVGLDVKCNYLFKSIEPSFIRAEAIYPMLIEDIPKKTTKKQTSITDTYKQRKRKTNESDITQSKEKKKRETALIEQFKVLKNSFEETSKELKEGRSKPAQVLNQFNDDIAQDVWGNTSIDSAMGKITDDYAAIEMDIPGIKKSKDPVHVKPYDIYPQQDTEELYDEDTLIVDDRIDNILNEIETEISKSKTATNLSNGLQSSFFVEPSSNNTKQQATSNRFPKLDMYKYYNEGKKRKNTTSKSNFSFIDTIEKKANLTQNTDNIPQKDSGFSDTIKSQIQKFLQGTSNKTSNNDSDIYELLEPVTNIQSDTREEPQSIKNYTANIIAGANNIPTELPVVYLNTKETVPNQHLISLHDNHDESTAITLQIKKGDAAVLNLHKEANFDSKADNYTDRKVVIAAIQIETTEKHNDGYVRGAVDKINAQNTIATVKEKDENKIQKERYVMIKDIILNDMIGNDNGQFKNDIANRGPFINDLKINTYKNDTLKNDIIIEKEVEDNFEEDIMSVRQIIKRKNNYEMSLDSPQPTTVSNCLLGLTTNDSLTNTQTGTKLDLLCLSDGSECRTNVTTFKNPTFKPPLKQTTTKAYHAFTKKVNSASESKKRDDISSYTQNGQITEKKVSNTCEKHPVVNPSEEEMPQNQNEREAFVYKSQYCFSTTKIDVCTKNMPAHRMQIIRKVKLDVDVTEIVSKVDNLKQTKTKIAKNCENCNIDNMTHQPYCNKTDSIPSSELSSAKSNFGVDKEIINIEEPSKYLIISNVDQKELPHEKLFKPECRGNYGNILSLPVYKKNITKSKADNTKQTERHLEFITRNEKHHSLDNKIKIKHDCGLTSIKDGFHVANENKSVEDIKNDLSPLNIDHIYLRRDNLIDSDRTAIYFENDKNNDKTKNGDGDKNVSSTIVNNRRDVSSDSKKKDMKAAPETKQEIGNILQKYSVLLRKNSSNINNTENNKIFQDKTKQPTVKTKRTYKINDIHNLEIPLPKTLIAVEATRSPRPGNKGSISKIKDVESGTDNLKKKYVVNETSNSFKIRDINSSIHTSDAFENTDTNLEPIPPLLPKTGNEQYLDSIEKDFHKEISTYLSPVDDIPILEPLEEFDLDQSMLNPQTLLQQCFSKEDDDVIIPPPSGFCDNNGKNTYSPTHIDGELDFTYQEFNETHEDETSDLQIESIFEDNTLSLLSPFQETETWTFSRDDDAETNSRRFEINKKYIPIKTCMDVMHSNSPTRENLYLPQETNKTSKLGQFKFKHKKKLIL